MDPLLTRAAVSSAFRAVTILEAINSAALKLEKAGITSARLDAEVLLCHTLGKDRAWLLAHMPESMGKRSGTDFEKAVKRRARREPLQYITGMQEFWGLEFRVTPDVLIPRPETELIIESALAALKKGSRPATIIDLCTGSGCIAVSLAKESPSVRVFATDKSAKALAVARQNASANGVADLIRFCEGDLFDPLEKLDIEGQVELIVSNPPYVPSGDFGSLQPEVRDYEPSLALFAGPDGTELHRRIISVAPRFLKDNGTLIMEMGLGQSAKLAQIVEKQGSYRAVDVLKDLAGIERVMVAQKK